MTEASVRYVHFEDHGMGYKPALCVRGRKHMHCVINDETGVRVLRVPVRDADIAPPVAFRGGAYPVTRFKEEMLRIGQRKGITIAATELLNGASEPPDEDAPAVPTPLTPEKPANEVPAAPGRGLIGALAAGFKLEPAVVRRRLRAAGLHAPYTDIAAATRALTS